MGHFTSNGTGQCQNGSSNLLTSYREQPRSTRTVVAYPRPAFVATKRTSHDPISFNQPVQVFKGHTSCRKKEKGKNGVHGSGGLELVKPAREPASSRLKSCAALKNAPRILPVRRSLLTLEGRKHTMVRDQPQKPLGLGLWFSITGAQQSPGSSTIELPSAFAKSGAYPPDRALRGSPWQCPLLSACHPLPKGIKLKLGRGVHLENTILDQQHPRRV